MTAPIPQSTTEPEVDPNAPPVQARVPLQELIEQQREGTLTGRIMPRLYDDFEQGIVSAFDPPAPETDPAGESDGAAGGVVLTPPPAPPASVTETAEPLTYTVDGRTLTEEELRTALAAADQASHLQPMLEALSTGDYVLAPKAWQPQAAAPRQEQPASAPVDPIHGMIEQYEQVDPQAAQIMRVMQQRHDAEIARMHAQTGVLQQNDEQFTVTQQTNGLNAGVDAFKQRSGLDDAAIQALSERAGQTGYLPMMMERRYQAAAESGQPIDHAAIARDATLELLDYAKAMYMPASQPVAPAFVTSPAPTPIPATQSAPVPMTEQDIEARVQARLAEELNKRNQRQAHTALAGGSSGTPSHAPVQPDMTSWTPAQRRAWHEQQLVAGIAGMKQNGQLDALY